MYMEDLYMNMIYSTKLKYYVICGLSGVYIQKKLFLVFFSLHMKVKRSKLGKVFYMYKKNLYAT
jgi:hypothetical protein